jgi:glycyl-tRNA synthetase beta chain
MKTADLLLEIGCEEIPAGMLPRACADFQVILEKHFSALGLLNGGTVETLGAPRRIAAMARDLKVRQEDEIREVLGPPKSVAFDSVGAPTRAAESFASKQGVAVSKLKVVTTPRGEYLAVQQVIPGRAAADLLMETLPRAIQEIPWPRTMHWVGLSGPRFIRPIRWMVALLGGKPLRFEIAGVRAGNASSGHRFLGKARIPLTGPRDYLARLKANGVLALPVERGRKIDEELQAAARKAGLRIHADTALQQQVTWLNEFPGVILGSFDEGYLDLPNEILITVMRDHQKYFALERRDGSLAPNFLAVINLDRDRTGEIRRGHERVLRSRFADARFFWQADQKRRLADYLPRLAQVTFQARLGSYGHKVERVTRIAKWLAERLVEMGQHQADVAATVRAAELAKCDLVTDMVREFSELQGVVGGLYARAQGEPEEVAEAVYDHYRPAGPDDELPRSFTGSLVSIADKLDTLAACFAVGLVPTGSSDPYGLRRAAAGIVRILLEKRIALSLSAAMSAAVRVLASHAPKIHAAPEVEAQALEFLVERVRYYCRERLGYAYDEVGAVLAAGADDLVDAEKRLAAVKAIRRTKNFEPLAVAFKRIRKILEKAGPAKEWRAPAVNSVLFAEDAERSLHQAAQQAAAEAGRHKRAGNYREALVVISGLRPAVDAFFDGVLVNAEDEPVRRNRLTLLAELLREFSTIADFSEIVPES